MLEPRIMPASYASFFMFILVHMLVLVVSCLAIYASFRRSCSRYGDILIFLTAYLYCFRLFCAQMHVQQYACLVFVVDHTRCMVFDYGTYIQQYCIYSIIHSLYILCSHFHNSQYSFETINHSTSSYYDAAAVLFFS